MENNMLGEELKYFEKSKSELLGKAKGEFALIHGSKLIDTFKSRDDAIKRGYEKIGNSPFLVKLIIEVEDVLNFTNHLLAS